MQLLANLIVCECVVRAMNRTGQTAVAHFIRKGTTNNKIFNFIYSWACAREPPPLQHVQNREYLAEKIATTKKQHRVHTCKWREQPRRNSTECNKKGNRIFVCMFHLYCVGTVRVFGQALFCCLSNFSFKIEIKHLTNPNYCRKNISTTTSWMRAWTIKYISFVCWGRGVLNICEKTKARKFGCNKGATYASKWCSVGFSLLRYILYAILFISSVYFFFGNSNRTIMQICTKMQGCSPPLKNENFLPTNTNEILNERRNVAW